MPRFKKIRVVWYALGASSAACVRLHSRHTPGLSTPQVQADAALRQLVMGETDSVHNVVMSAVQADMSFRFVLELRNRLTEAYQEIMRMQV